MFALPISKPRFKSIIFNQNSPKMKLFLQKNAKFLSAGGSVPLPPCLRQLRALPPNPQPPAAGGFAPRPPWPPAAGGTAPKPPKQPSIVNFWRRARTKPSHTKTYIKWHCVKAPNRRMMGQKHCRKFIRCFHFCLYFRSRLYTLQSTKPYRIIARNPGV